MKCKCGNDIQVLLEANVACKGCKILTSMTTVMTVECNGCGAKFQVPVSGGDVVVKQSS
jgi:hypothetical protein